MLQIVHSERLTYGLGDARLCARKGSALPVREMTAGAPELHGKPLRPAR